MSEEYEHEDIPGLPGQLPEGETLLWQGHPTATGVARHILHVRLIAAYFAVLAGWRLFEAYWTGGDMHAAALSAAWLAIIAGLGIGIVALISRAMARSTIYSITSHRVVMRIGTALPMTINLPFGTITSANLKANRDGTGDIALELQGKARLGYVHLWPHARPWHLKTPQPMMRSVREPERVANILSQALAAQCPTGSRTPARVETRANAEARGQSATASNATGGRGALSTA